MIAAAAKTIKLAPEISTDGVTVQPDCRIRRCAVAGSAKRCLIRYAITYARLCVNWRGRRESNPHPLSGAQGLCR